MGILVAKRYLAKDQLDHTYVQCSTGKKAWACWGGKSGGTALREATGSTERADKIAQTDEKARINCYLINGTCHQAANRILHPAGITCRGAKGYSISEALFGPYGRKAFWPCSSPFDKHESTTGDPAGCRVKVARVRRASAARSVADQLDWVYLQRALDLYEEQERIRDLTATQIEEFNVEMFALMAEFRLGPLLSPQLKRELLSIRRKTERSRLEAESTFAKNPMHGLEFVDDFNKITLEFQKKMAGALAPAEYVTLFDVEPGRGIEIADPKVVEKVYGPQ